MLVLAAWAVLAGAALGRWSEKDVAMADECIYLVVARNLLERGTLDTNLYLASSILVRGHPHRDVHLPGYVLLLAPFVAAFGPVLKAAVVLNLVALVAAVLLAHAIALRVLGDDAAALAAAALVPVVPPIPGYVWIAFPELPIVAALLLGVWWTLRGGGAAQAAAAGFWFGAAALLRETVMLGAPFALLLLPRRRWAPFAGGLALALAIVVAPLAGGRAVHPNALYPSVFQDAAAAASPVTALLSALWTNVTVNVQWTLGAEPLASAEDLMLAAMLLVTIAGLLASFFLPGEARRFAAGLLASLAVLTVAVLALYVVRVRGGVWGGVRAYMAWMPLALVLLVGGLFRKGRLPGIAACVLLAGGFAWAGRVELAKLAHLKRTTVEDEDRLAATIDHLAGVQRPQRLLAKTFRYAFTHYPAEVIWGLPRDHKELVALEKAISFDYVAVYWKSDLRLFLIRNPRYVRLNRDDRDASYLVFRRLD